MKTRRSVGDPRRSAGDSRRSSGKELKRLSDGNIRITKPDGKSYTITPDGNRV